MLKITCKVCQKAFKSITNTHLFKHGLTVKEYKIKFNQVVVSEDTIKRRWTKENRRKYSESRKNKFKSGELTSIFQDVERKKEIARLNSVRMKGEGNPMKNPDVRKKVSEKLIGRKGKIRTKEWCKNLSKSKKGARNLMKRREVAVKNACSHNREKSGIEKEFEDLVEGLPIKYVGNNKLWIGGKNPDYVYKEKKFVIEVTSTAYNRVENKYEENRIKYFQKYGYKVVTLRMEYVFKHCKEQFKQNLLTFFKKILYENYSYQITHTKEGEINCIQF